jgi:hypothetical protein
MPPLCYTRIAAASCTANVPPLPNLIGHLDRRFTWIAPDEQRDTAVGTPAVALNDVSALRAREKMLGVPCLNGACTAAGMGAPFHL